MQENETYSHKDLEAVKILADFLPERIFDAHAHLYDSAFRKATFPAGSTPQFYGAAEYIRDMSAMLGNPKELQLNIIPFPDKSMADPLDDSCDASDAFLKNQLDLLPNSVGEIITVPGDTPESLAGRLTHPNIRGFKCYHLCSGLENSWNANIGQYLPEAAWQVANEKKMAITLHMVKDNALSDPENLAYIKTMAKAYPNATLILAHAARSFAAWTGVESVEKVACLDNVWFDLSAVCEPTAMIQIFKKIGTQRVMWGSDYPISMMRGKVVSLGDTFCWIFKEDLERFGGTIADNSWLVGIENLMAIRQASMIMDLSADQLESVFWRNAKQLFG